ncbi:Putative fluoride ion transporter CrcB [Commensalibacter sp. Nvir]|uniref:fluoride efflux transporter CrcB n=1 Tax=Commensalibacter sp. Nvir TaxID=3069817 RepID=UPI002D4AC962|nr:Putative fluoride ion transporter CrcB [Commensalibacter sp. Nvir]
MFNSIMLISIGGSLGCLLRWWLGFTLNAVFPYLPLGTLAANCLAGYCIGVTVALFVLIPSLIPWRLFIITGLLGGLSTFSSFSLEVVLLMQEGKFGWAIATVFIHVVASIALTILGMLTVYGLRSCII